MFVTLFQMIMTNTQKSFYSKSKKDRFLKKFTLILTRFFKIILKDDNERHRLLTNCSHKQMLRNLA